MLTGYEVDYKFITFCNPMDNVTTRVVVFTVKKLFLHYIVKNC